MSLQQHAFINKSKVPSRDEWQKAIDKLGYDFQLYPELKAFKDSGFVPCKLNNTDTGFEINYEDTKKYKEIYPSLRNKLTNKDYCITFTWGSSMTECASVLIACISLINLANSIIYYPNDDMVYEKENLKADIDSCLKKIGQ